MKRRVVIKPVVSVISLTLAVVLTACSSKGPRASEGQCQEPIMKVTPEQVQPGDSVTVTWVGPVDCEGEPLFPEGTVQISLTGADEYPTGEPFTMPSAVVEDWTAIDLRTTPSPTL